MPKTDYVPASRRRDPRRRNSAGLNAYMIFEAVSLMDRTRDFNSVLETNSSPYLFSVSCFLPRIWTTHKSVFFFLTTPYNSFSVVSILIPCNLLHVTPTVSSYNTSDAVFFDPLRLPYSTYNWTNFRCFSKQKPLCIFVMPTRQKVTVSELLYRFRSKSVSQ